MNLDDEQVARTHGRGRGDVWPTARAKRLEAAARLRRNRRQLRLDRRSRRRGSKADAG